MDGYYSVGIQPSLGYSVEPAVSNVADIVRSVGRGVFLGCLAISVAASVFITLAIIQPNFLVALNGWGTTIPATTANISSLPAQPPVSKPLEKLATTALPPVQTAPSNSIDHILANFAATHTGTIAVATSQLGGSGQSGSYQADLTLPIASTHKLFEAYVALRGVEQRKLTLNTSINGHTLYYCIRQMILVSDNDCADELGTKLGWDYLNTQVHNDGFTHINLNSPDNITYGTARDEAQMLAKLNAGQLINSTHTAYLLDLMKNQVYRDGIPAGSAGAVVADKVGFNNNLNHDMGIVYAPKATYSLVILTNNASSTVVHDLSKQIYDYYNQP